jgi:hypothetical protein
VVAVAPALLVVMLELSAGMVEMVVAAQVQVSLVHLSLMLVAAAVLALPPQAPAAPAVEVQQVMAAMVRLALRTEVVVVEVLVISHPVLAGREL